MYILTICCHADLDALLEATLLALVPCDFVNDAFGLILARVRRVQVLLDGSPEEALSCRGLAAQLHSDIIQKPSQNSVHQLIPMTTTLLGGVISFNEPQCKGPNVIGTAFSHEILWETTKRQPRNAKGGRF